MLELIKLKILKIKELVTKENIKKLIDKIMDERKYLFYIVLGVLGVELLITIFLLIRLYINKETLENKSDSLLSLSSYNIDYNSLNKLSINGLYSTGKVQDMIKEFEGKKQEREKITKQFDKLQAPYNHFLKYIYLPTLNIWQDPFTKKVDTTLIGNNFLKKNPYVDTNLLNKWSNFFRNLGDGISFNEITDINIGDIKPQKEYFIIPINVSFDSPDRRSFLMLVNKLSITSNKRNISLVNEYTYNLWQSIIKANKEFFSPSSSSVGTGDEKISAFLGEVFYRSIVEDKTFIDTQNINEFYTFVIDAGTQSYRIVLNKKYVDNRFSFLNNLSKTHYDIAQNLSTIGTGVETLVGDNGLISRVINVRSGESLKNTDEVQIKKILFANRTSVYLNVDRKYNIVLRFHEEEKLIKLHLDYNMIFYKLLNDDIISSSIYSSVNCDAMSLSDSSGIKNCYFKFRDKYRDIPYLAYMLGNQGKDKLSNLLYFYRTLPPILNVTKFVFKETDRRFAQDGKGKFQGDIAIELYGKNIGDDEILNIQKTLGTICFAGSLDKKDFVLSPDTSLNLIAKEITAISGKDNVDSKIVGNLVEIQGILNEIKKDYTTLNNYSKIVKLFEIYRIISENDGGICKN